MRKERYTFYTLYSVFIGALGGFLYGFQLASIAGALIFLTPAFHLTPLQEGWVVSMLLVGAFGGALCAGTCADRIGRKKTILLAAALCIAGTLLLSFATSYALLLVGRAVAGISIGIISLVTPLYLAEISPPHSRGAFVSFNQLAITMGILVAYLISLSYAKSGDWQMMFAWAIAPALMQVIGGLFLPETPSWLLQHHREESGLATLKKMRIDNQWQSCLDEMKRSASSHKKGGWKTLFQPRLRHVLVLGLALSAFQQITGINAVIYFAPKIFQIAGFASASSAIFASVGIGVINVLATLFSVFLLDRLGRRPLLLTGLIGMIASLLALSFAFFLKSSSIAPIALVSLMSYVAFFAIGLGPITWLLIAEIYPLAVRGKAMTIAVGMSWMSNYLISLIFLDLISYLGSSITFCLFSLISIIALIVIWRYVPETKGKRLEEIENELVR